MLLDPFISFVFSPAIVAEMIGYREEEESSMSPAITLSKALFAL